MSVQYCDHMGKSSRETRTRMRLKKQSRNLERAKSLGEKRLDDMRIHNNEIDSSSVVEYLSTWGIEVLFIVHGSETSHSTMRDLIPRSLPSCGVGSVDPSRNEAYCLRLCRVVRLKSLEKS